MDEFKILSDLVKIRTIRDENNKQFIEYISKLLKGKDFNIEIVTSSDGKSCLVAKTKEECNLCFMGHSDTVDYNPGWQTDPFTLTLKDDMLYGLGACDMKGGIAAFLDAIDNVNVRELKKGLMVITTYDEEIGFDGIKLIKDRKDLPENIIIGESTDMVPVAFIKGCMEFKATFKGLAVHSSYMPRGINAIEKAVEFIRELNEFAVVLKKDQNEKFDIPFATMNIAIINGGNAINKVPDRCELEFDFRTILEDQHEVIYQKIAELAKKYNCEIEVINDVMPKNTRNQESIEIIEKLLNEKTTGVNYTTEGNFIKGRNIFILGPGPITGHEIDEHISVKSYRRAKKAYTDIINSFCK